MAIRERRPDLQPWQLRRGSTGISTIQRINKRSNPQNQICKRLCNEAATPPQLRIPAASEAPVLNPEPDLGLGHGCTLTTTSRSCLSGKAASTACRKPGLGTMPPGPKLTTGTFTAAGAWPPAYSSVVLRVEHRGQWQPTVRYGRGQG